MLAAAETQWPVAQPCSVYSAWDKLTLERHFSGLVNGMLLFFLVCLILVFCLFYAGPVASDLMADLGMCYLATEFGMTGPPGIVFQRSEPISQCL